MLPSLLLGTAVVAAACAACSDRSSDPGPAPSSTAAAPIGPVTMREPSGAIAMTVEVTGGSCSARFGGTVARYVRNGEALSGPLGVEMTPAGQKIKRDGKDVVRIWRDPTRPGHTDVVDPEGMALARVDATTTSATIADAGGSPTAKIVFEGGRFVATDVHAAALAYVTGGDAETAALLAAPLPLDVRALAACDRLLSAPVPP